MKTLWRLVCANMKSMIEEPADLDTTALLCCDGVSRKQGRDKYDAEFGWRQRALAQPPARLTVARDATRVWRAKVAHSSSNSTIRI